MPESLWSSLDPGSTEPAKCCEPGVSPVSGSASAGLLLGWAPGFMELTWCWGGLGAWVCDSRPGTGPGWEPGFMGASLVPVLRWAGILGLQEPTGSLTPQEPPGAVEAGSAGCSLHSPATGRMSVSPVGCPSLDNFT